MWRDFEDQQNIPKVVVTEVVEKKEKKEDKVIRIGLIVMALMLLVYFIYLFLEYKMLDYLRLKLLRAQSSTLTGDPSEESIFGLANDLEHMVRG